MIFHKKIISFARYPFSSKEDKQFYVNSTQNEVIDLEILFDQIVYIYSCVVILEFEVYNR